jgi:hypothetical protein
VLYHGYLDIAFGLPEELEGILFGEQARTDSLGGNKSPSILREAKL